MAGGADPKADPNEKHPRGRNALTEGDPGTSQGTGRLCFRVLRAGYWSAQGESSGAAGLFIGGIADTSALVWRPDADAARGRCAGAHPLISSHNMSYDVFLLHESDAFPNDPASIGSHVSVFLAGQDDSYVPTAEEVQLVEAALAEFTAMGPEVGVDVGVMDAGAMSISIAYWPDTVPHLPRIAEVLNSVRAELGEGWFFFDPQLDVAVRSLPPQDVQSVFLAVLSPPDPPSWRTRLGFPAHRTTRQKWTDAAIFALVVLGLVYAVLR